MWWGAYEFDHLLFLFRHASVGIHAGHAWHTAWASWKGHGAEVCGGRGRDDGMFRGV
jgi:hypothetical protein